MSLQPAPLPPPPPLPFPSVSRLMLGTVQFGLPYGVANRTGQPSREEVREILRLALDHGVTAFDTAAAYGNSEEVLGEAFADLGVADRVTVVTKVRPVSSESQCHPERAAREIAESIEQSRRKLRLPCLPLVLFHAEADHVHLPVLREFGRQGWLNQVGVSCGHHPTVANQLVANQTVSALQVPANVLDPRHLESGLLTAAAAAGVAIFARSAFLQGLLVMPETEVPLPLQAVLPARRALAEIARHAGMDLAELCLRYLLSFEGIRCVVAGVETAAQLRANLTLFHRGPLPADLLHALRTYSFLNLRAAVPELVITPNQWPKHST